MKISGKTKICLIIGDPVEHTLSPKMHNTAYESLGIDDQFVYVAANVKVEDVVHVVKAMRVMQIHGLTCTIPHKMEIIKYLDQIDSIAKKIGAVNTVVNENGILKGYNTDWLGATIPLEKITTIKNKKVALIGAGGAARAIAFGIVEKGGKLTIYNRTPGKAVELAKELGAEGKALTDLAEIKDADIVINSTSLGMSPNDKETPVPAEYISSRQIAFDAVYTPYKTRFLTEAEQKGAKIIPGMEMLLHQGTAQFEYYTNVKAPEDVMRATLLEHFHIH